MIAILENLKSFWGSKPPLVLFMLCLGIFAVVLLTLGYIVKVNDLKNPDAVSFMSLSYHFNNRY